jgi:hypothetical protein
LPSPLVVDSVTQLQPSARGGVAICGSHGGVYSAYLAAKAGLRAVILHDAGVGCGGAGIAGLGYLGALGVPAAVVDGRSARIGDGADCAARGRISHANGIAAALGCRAGQRAADAAALLEKAAPSVVVPPEAREARSRIDGPWNGQARVWALDSASLVVPDDAGHVVLTGSHGGLLGGLAESALKVDALAALYSDATGGIDGAGFTRLPALDRRGIAAATVDAMRARIGDGRSTYADGILTRVNETAAAHGARPGMTAHEFVLSILQKNPGEAP